MVLEQKQTEQERKPAVHIKAMFSFWLDIMNWLDIMIEGRLLREYPLYHVNINNNYKLRSFRLG